MSLAQRLFPIPAVGRRLFWAFVLVQTPQLLHLIYLCASLKYPGLKVSISTQVWAIVAMLVLMIAAIIWMGITLVRLRRAATARGGAVCLHCLYHLPMGDEAGTCPECGRAFTLVENRAAWGLQPCVHGAMGRSLL